MIPRLPSIRRPPLPQPYVEREVKSALYKCIGGPWHARQIRLSVCCISTLQFECYARHMVGDTASGELWLYRGCYVKRTVKDSRGCLSMSPNVDDQEYIYWEPANDPG